MTYTVTELQGFVKTTVNGGLDARTLVLDEIVKVAVPPVLEAIFCDVGVTLKLESAVTLIVPGPLTAIFTVAELPPLFRTEIDPTLAPMVPPTQVAVGGVMTVPPPPPTLQGLSSG